MDFHRPWSVFVSSAAAPLAVATMTTVCLVLILAIVAANHPGDIDDELVIGAIAIGALMTLLGAVIVAVVFFPTVLMVHAVVGRWDRPGLYGATLVAAVPLAVLVFASLFRVLGLDDTGRSLAALLTSLLADPSELIPLVVSAAAGAIVFGVAFSRRMASLPAPPNWRL